MNATVGVPTGSSKLCLSCHDGTIAIGSTMNNGADGDAGVNGRAVDGRLGRSAPDLGDDHPISFVPVVGRRHRQAAGGEPVKLDANGQVQCRTCHDPHRMDIDTTTKKFLVVNNSSSALCVVCHKTRTGRPIPSTHKTSTKSLHGGAGRAHRLHDGGDQRMRELPQAAQRRRAERTLKAQEELRAGHCRSATAPPASAATSQSEFQKAVPPSDLQRDAVGRTIASESPSNPSHPLPETSAAAARHAECADCHNAHASYAAPTTAPKGSGKLAGVWGIDTQRHARRCRAARRRRSTSTRSATSATPIRPTSRSPLGPTPPYPNRVVVQWNKRLQFDPANPVVPPDRGGGEEPVGSQPHCAVDRQLDRDVHRLSRQRHRPECADPGTGPSGPHGSQYQAAARRPLRQGHRNTTESAAAYALCYKCHDRTRVRTNPGQFSDHGKHITEYDASCSLCHDPHGVANTTHLVNFDKRFVSPKNGVLTWTPGNNGCTLTCHGASHPR